MRIMRITFIIIMILNCFDCAEDRSIAKKESCEPRLNETSRSESGNKKEKRKKERKYADDDIEFRKGGNGVLVYRG